MKETGVVRRIDELGRIVIPKEIRRRFQIDNGDLVDIYIDNKQIVLRKFHPLAEISPTIQYLLTALATTSFSKLIVTDKYQVIASSDNSIAYGETLAVEFQKRVKDLLEIDGSKALNLKITESYTIDADFYAKEIRLNGELFGYVIILDKMISNRTKELAVIVNKYLSLSIS